MLKSKYMKIAIVEDSASDLADTISALNRFNQESGSSIEYDVFGSAEDFLKVSSKYRIGIFDIVLPGMTGMELAHKIRETDKDMAIVFLTTLEKYAVEGYMVNASGYVVKPINYFAFTMALRRAVSSYESIYGTEEQSVIKAGTKTIVLNSVLYCEVRDHTLVYHLKDEEVSCRGSLSDVEKYNSKSFSKSHSSFLINFAYVQAVGSDSVILTNGDAVRLIHEGAL